MKLIVGLGNPGLRYKNTRHNIGFLVLKEVSKKFGIAVRKRKYKGLFGTGPAAGTKVALFMPLTFMNLSGEAVLQMVKKEKIRPEDLLVISDDIDLQFGSMRLRKNGSSGGHKGLGSIIKNLGTSDFPRLRMGIGKPSKPRDVSNFVLTLFDRGERPLLKGIIKEAALCVDAWLKSGPDEAMARFNKRIQPDTA